MVPTAHIVRCNENVISVFLNKKQLAELDLEARKAKHYSECKSKFKNDPKLYAQKYNWRITTHIVSTYPIQRHTPRGRTHVPETFPHPIQSVLPGQVQLKRVQLPAVREPEIFCPICESTTKDHHKPQCPEINK